MSYMLSWRDFEAYMAGRTPSAATTVPDALDGEIEAQLYVWRRFRRCHGNPVPAPSLYPVAVGCEPAVFNGPDHWDAWFRKLVKLRGRDVGFVNDTNLFEPHDFRDPDDDPWDRVEGQGVAVEDRVIGEEELDRLRRHIEERFDAGFAYGPETRQAMVEAAGDLAAGSPLDLASAVGEALAGRLPDTFGSDDAGRQRRKRVLDRRVRPFLTAFGANL